MNKPAKNISINAIEANIIFFHIRLFLLCFKISKFTIIILSSLRRTSELYELRNTGKVRRRDIFFFDTSLIFTSFSSFNIIRREKKANRISSVVSPKKKYIFAIELRISKRYIDMKKEKNFSES